MRIVITGGSRGIGRMIWNGIAQGNQVFVISRRKLLDTSTASSIPCGDDNCNIKAYEADVSDYESLSNAFRHIGNFDALINCAGILGPVSGIENTDMGLWEKTLRVNLIGTANACRLAVPLIKAGKGNEDVRGKIINFAGGGAAFPRVYHSSYAASKAAVVRLTECLARDFMHDKIKIDINAVAPGAHNTDIWKDESFDAPPKEWAEPGLLLKLVRFLLSMRSDGISGKFIHIKDNYEVWTPAVSNSDSYTLRRIDCGRFLEKQDERK